MKKLFITALVAVSASLSAYSQDVTNEKAVSNFEATFTDVSNVEWVSKENFTKAFFIQDDKNVEAFYDLNGDLIATTTAIDKEELPAFVKTTFRKKYVGYRINEAFEFSSDEETAYFIAAEKGKEKIVIKVKEGSFSVYSKI